MAWRLCSSSCGYVSRWTARDARSRSIAAGLVGTQTRRSVRAQETGPQTTSEGAPRAIVFGAAGVPAVSNYNKYRVPRLGDMPTIAVSIVSSTASPGGVGETGVPCVAPAIVNAWAALTGTQANLTAALGLAVEMLRSPAFPEAEFDQVKAQRIAAVDDLDLVCAGVEKRPVLRLPIGVRGDQRPHLVGVRA